MCDSDSTPREKHTTRTLGGRSVVTSHAHVHQQQRGVEWQRGDADTALHSQPPRCPVQHVVVEARDGPPKPVSDARIICQSHDTATAARCCQHCAAAIASTQCFKRALARKAGTAGADLPCCRMSNLHAQSHRQRSPRSKQRVCDAALNTSAFNGTSPTIRTRGGTAARPRASERSVARCQRRVSASAHRRPEATPLTLRMVRSHSSLGTQLKSNRVAVTATD